MSNPEIILTVFLIFFVIFCFLVGYNFITEEIKQETILRNQPSLRRETPKERRERIEAKYK